MTTALVAEWTPTDDDVAALIPTRTGDATGLARGAFTEETVPTQAQVYEAINGVVAEVHGAVGEIPVLVGVENPKQIVEPALRCVTLGAAADVELTFYPDQGAMTRSPGEVLYERYQAALKLLKGAVDRANNGQPLNGSDTGVPVYSFPTAADVPRPPITTYAESF